MIMDMYDRARTKVRCTAGTSEDFFVKIGVHQGSVLSPLLFILVVNYLTKDINAGQVWALLFADDIALASESIVALQNALNLWKEALEGSGLKISVSKTEFMDCKFSNDQRPSQILTLNGERLKECHKFKYLGSVINNTATCDDDLNHRVSVGWQKWKENSSIFCDRKMPLKLKGKLYSTVVRPALLYGSQCWTLYKNYENKMTATEMKMCRMSVGVTKLDHIRSTRIRGSLHIKKPIVEKMRDDRKGWFEHVLRRPPENPVQRAISTEVQRTLPPKRGRRKLTWTAQMQQLHQRQQQIGQRNLRSNSTPTL